MYMYQCNIEMIVIHLVMIKHLSVILLSRLKYCVAASTVYFFNFEISATERTDWEMRAPISEHSGWSGRISSASSYIHVVTPTQAIQKWRLSVPVGDKLELTWTLTAQNPVSVQVSFNAIKL